MNLSACRRQMQPTVRPLAWHCLFSSRSSKVDQQSITKPWAACGEQHVLLLLMRCKYGVWSRKKMLGTGHGTTTRYINSTSTIFPFILSETVVPFTVVRTTTISETTACTYPLHTQGRAWTKEESTTCSTTEPFDEILVRTTTLSTTRACTYPIHVQGSAWAKRREHYMLNR